MIEVKLTGYEQTVINIPESPDEVSLAQGVRFTNKWRHFIAWLEERSDDDIVSYKGQLEYVNWLADIISSTYDIDKEKILGQHVGDWVEHARRLKGTEEEVDVDSAQHTLLWIFDKTQNAVRYTSKVSIDKPYEFEHWDVGRKKVTTWYIAAERAAMHMSGAVLPTFTVGQVVEVMETNRLMSSYKSEQEDNAEFTRIVREIAILALKQGESFPAMPAQIDDFVNTRVKVFQDVSWKVACDIGFFLEAITPS